MERPTESWSPVGLSQLLLIELCAKLEGGSDLDLEPIPDTLKDRISQEMAVGLTKAASSEAHLGVSKLLKNEL